MRIFVFVDGDEVTALEADAVPRPGDAVWLKTDKYEGTSVVASVEHQFDRSTVERFGTHDVCLYTNRK